MFPSKILLCVDSEEHFAACRVEVGWIARHLETGLVLFHSAPELWLDAGPGLQHDQVREGWLDALVDDPALRNIEVETLSVATFDTLIDSILHAADKSGADMVLVPTHGRSGLDHMLYGSVAERVLRSCRIPVMTLDLQKARQAGGDAAFDRIVCPVDFSETAEHALVRACRLGKRLDVPVTALHVIDDYFAAAYPIDGIPSLDTYLPSLIEDVTRKVKNLAKEVGEREGAEVEGRCEVGSVVATVADVLAEHANPLVVMATAGRDTLGDHVLGSRTERIVRTAHVPVLALPKSFLTEA
ncbi:MAG: universal stress protein [Planctomycetes bacterium]|nr:universal stress protein [Planctomycetota bacterium]